jgi:predicted transcriptional regulator
MDLIKESFQRVKEDISSLQNELNNLKKELFETREKLIEICEIMQKISEKVEKRPSTHNQENKTLRQHASTHSLPLEPLKPQNIGISTGNQGVSTDRQTDRQTHRQTQKTPENSQNTFENALEILDSLDDLKKEIRLKFKRLTDQEILIFSTIYQIEEEKGYANYKSVSEKLDLTESSVRDYVGRLIKKGIPVDKKKINNKQIQLNISQNLKKIATLPTILQLRGL